RRQCAPPFGLIADVLFQIIINGDASTILTLCLINKTTFDTIKVLEPHICKWFMRLHDIDTFSPLLTLNPWTGKQNALTVHTLVRSLYRHNVARCLSRQIVPSVWGPFYDDDKAEMNFEAELKLANRLERGFHVLFHMADISRDIKRGRQFHRKASLSSSMSKRLTKLHKRLKEYSDMNFDFNSPDSNNNNNYYYYQKLLLQPDHTKPRSKSHTTEILKWAQTESEIGQRRLDFRANHLDEKSEVAFHCTLRMLRELLERIVLRHGPRLWHRDTRNEYSVVSWFLLNQGPRDLAKLVLTPQDECCHYHFHPDPSTDGEECLFSNPLDEYWDAWKDSPGLGCAGARKGACVISNCNCKRRVRSWSVKPALFDNQGRGYNRAAERYLKEMWGQRHVGLHQAFTMGIFATVF
ncbi:hypothetical protein ASPSYDRAFT_161741, partial [Aspergillus sydowii CBS 593.65]